eukprot:765957-Hanusia_phi.AAC.9
MWKQLRRHMNSIKDLVPPSAFAEAMSHVSFAMTCDETNIGDKSLDLRIMLVCLLCDDCKQKKIETFLLHVGGYATHHATSAAGSEHAGSNATRQGAHDLLADIFSLTRMCLISYIHSALVANILANTIAILTNILFFPVNTLFLLMFLTEEERPQTAPTRSGTSQLQKIAKFAGSFLGKKPSNPSSLSRMLATPSLEQ